jgi:hypothetical protein
LYSEAQENRGAGVFQIVEMDAGYERPGNHTIDGCLLRWTSNGDLETSAPEKPKEAKMIIEFSSESGFIRAVPDVKRKSFLSI